MTTPEQRTEAVLDAEVLLSRLALESCSALSEDVVRASAAVVLEHFPRVAHIRLSAALLPEIWGEPSGNNGHTV